MDLQVLTQSAAGSGEHTHTAGPALCSSRVPVSEELPPVLPLRSGTLHDSPVKT